MMLTSFGTNAGFFFLNKNSWDIPTASVGYLSRVLEGLHGFSVGSPVSAHTKRRPRAIIRANESDLYNLKWF